MKMCGKVDNSSSSRRWGKREGYKVDSAQGDAREEHFLAHEENLRENRWRPLFHPFYGFWSKWIQNKRPKKSSLQSGERVRGNRYGWRVGMLVRLRG